MSGIPDAVWSVVAAFVSAVFLFAGSKFVARQTREVGEKQLEIDQRKVDQEAFDRFVSRYEADRDRQDEELNETRTVLTETRALLRNALKHINLLRSEMRKHDIDPPDLPDALQDVPWSLFGSERR